MDQGIYLLLAFARIAAVVMTAPILGSRVVPIRMRIGIAVVLTAAAFPLIGQTSVVLNNVSQIPGAIFSEVVIGAMLGLGVMIMFAAAQMAGTVIGQMAGLQISETLDPNTGQMASPVAKLFGILSLAAFALVGGPELVVTATLDTFLHLPLGTQLESQKLLALTTELLQQSFMLTLRGVAPAVAALMISTIVIGLISRTYPQMNLLGLGLSSNLVVMLLAIFFTLGGSVWLFVDDLEHYIAMIGDALRESVVEPTSDPITPTAYSARGSINP
ncbi:MAG: flagellar biosynthetic protein FliR [Mariniblastus sp.]|jgi:flagellar biosynthetic protein FliR